MLCVGLPRRESVSGKRREHGRRGDQHGAGGLNRRSQVGWTEHLCPAFQKCLFPAGGHSLVLSGRCPCGLQIVLVDDRECSMGRDGQGDAPPTPPPTPVDLDLDWVLGKMPRKVCGGREVSPSLAQPFRPSSALHVLCHLCAQHLPRRSHHCCHLCCRSSSSRGVSPCCGPWPCPQG